MTEPTVDLSDQQGVFAAALAYMQVVWNDRFATQTKAYDAAYKSVSTRLSNAGKTQEKALVAMVGKIADAVVKPFGIYGTIASVALAGLIEVAKGKAVPTKAVELKVPSVASFSADLSKTGDAMFKPLLAVSYVWAKEVLTQKKMDAEQFRGAKSRMLSSPLWFPPPELTDQVAQRQIEEVMWCSFFAGLKGAGYSSYELGFLDDIISYLISSSFVDKTESQGWSGYPTVVSQGGPGDWNAFLQKTERFWSSKLSGRVDAGWLTPLPVIPDSAKVQKSVNWTPQVTVKFKHPTKWQSAHITIVSVEETLYQALDWSDIPELPGNFVGPAVH